MRVAALLVILVSLTLTACQRTETAEEGGSTSTDTSRAAPQSAISRGDDCPIDTVARHADAVQLVREWVRHDAAGEMVSPDSWAAGALTCVEVATSDQVAIITGYEVRPLSATNDSVRVLIRYQRRAVPGYDDAGALTHLVLESRESTDTVVVIRTRYGWRIDQIEGGAHLLPDAALRVFGNRLRPADRDTLIALSRSVPQN